MILLENPYSTSGAKTLMMITTITTTPISITTTTIIIIMKIPLLGGEGGEGAEEQRERVTKRFLIFPPSSLPLSLFLLFLSHPFPFLSFPSHRIQEIRWGVMEVVKFVLVGKWERKWRDGDEDKDFFLIFFFFFSRRDHPLQPTLIPFITRDTSKEKIVHPYRIYIRGFGKMETPQRNCKSIYLSSNLHHTSLTPFPFLSVKSRKSELKQPNYQVEVRCGVSTWTVHRKYVDFLQLHRALCQKYPSVELPLLPPRVFEARSFFHHTLIFFLFFFC